MDLTHACIITERVADLRAFYREILKAEPADYGEDYVEFATGRGTLAIFSAEAHARLAPGSAEQASNRSVVLEFQTKDVDLEFERLKEMGVDIVKPLTTQPWGNRSFYFRDPDGNLVNFYSRVDSR